MDGHRAALVLALALALGIAGQALFFAVPLGVNLLVVVAAILVAARLTRSATARLDPVDAWLPVGALVLAAFVALRTDAVLVTLDTLGALALGSAAAVAIGGVEVSRRAAHHVVLLLAGVISGLDTAAAPVIAAVNRSYRPASVYRSSGPVAAAVRGVVIALPILLLFALLFAAADAVFARILGDVFTMDVDFGELLARLGFAIVVGWLCAGLLACVAFGASVTPIPEPGPDAAGAPETAPTGWRIGTIETLVVVVTVDLLFTLFVVIQATYLFGGRDTLEASGLTYSDYARRGFFELVTVAALAVSLLVVTDALVARRTRGVLLAELALCTLSGVVLVSAFMRLSLYQQAYGWTELRFYVVAAIIWLALGIVAVAAALVTRRMAWLPHGLALAALVVTVGVNVVGPQAFIASQNVARALDPSLVPADGETGLDEMYLSTLGYDAVPFVAGALPALEGRDREALAFSLAVRLHELDRDEGSRAWQAWNVARERAREALERVRDELPTVDAERR